MLEIPAFLFYVATAAMIVVSILLATLLYLLIVLAVNIKKLTSKAEHEADKWIEVVRPIRAAVRFITSITAGFIRLRTGVKKGPGTYISEKDIINN